MAKKPKEFSPDIEQPSQKPEEAPKGKASKFTVIWKGKPNPAFPGMVGDLVVSNPTSNEQNIITVRAGEPNELNASQVAALKADIDVQRLIKAGLLRILEGPLPESIEGLPDADALDMVLSCSDEMRLRAWQRDENRAEVLSAIAEQLGIIKELDARMAESRASIM